MGNAIKLADIWGSIIYNVKAFGAKGDGISNDTPFFEAAKAAAAVTGGIVRIPPGTYLVDQINADSGNVLWQGDRVYNNGAVLLSKSNKPIFYVTAGCAFDSISFIGSDNVSYTSQDGIFVDNTSNVSISNCFFDNLYNCIHLKDTVFFSTIEFCRFHSAKNALIYGEGTSSPGYQVTINNCIASIEESVYGFYFANAGTVTINDLEMSPTGCTDGGVVFASLATLAGVQQISHSRLEGSITNGLQLLGSSGNPIKYIFVTNSYIAGNPAVYAEYCTSVYFDNCYFTGSNDGAAGRNAFSAKYQGDNIQINNCEFQVTNVVLTADVACSSISYSVTNPQYSGSQPFIYLPFLDNTKVNRISVFGGKIGVNANPIELSYYFNDKVRIDVPGYSKTENGGIITLNGNATQQVLIPHGLNGTPNQFNVTIVSDNAATAGIFKIERNGTNLIISTNSPTTTGTGNLLYSWSARL